MKPKKVLKKIKVQEAAIKARARDEALRQRFIAEKHIRLQSTTNVIYDNYLRELAPAEAEFIVGMLCEKIRQEQEATIRKVYDKNLIEYYRNKYRRGRST